LLSLFFETAFGICMGWKIFNRFNPKQAELDPSDVCTIKPAEVSG
jgi:hypothetical protein